MEDSRYLDLIGLISLPLGFMALKNLIINRRSLFDDELTPEDKQQIRALAFFVVLPVIVLLHELGHAVCTEMFGLKVKEFHYAFMWGYVLPEGHMTALQSLLITVAGNAAQVLAGLCLLLAGLFVRSPFWCMLLIFSGLLSIAQTVVFYALMSLFGIYGDWYLIYTNPESQAVHLIALVHALIVIGLLYLVSARALRIWYQSRLDPQWGERFRQLMRQAQADPQDSKTQIALAAHCLAANLLSDAASHASAVLKAYPDQLSAVAILADVQARKNNLPAAISIMRKFTSTHDLSLEQRSLALIMTARYLLFGNDPLQALELCKQAYQSDPSCGDALLMQARILNILGRNEESLAILGEIFSGSLNWFNSQSQADYEIEYKIATEGMRRKNG